MSALRSIIWNPSQNQFNILQFSPTQKSTNQQIFRIRKLLFWTGAVVSATFTQNFFSQFRSDSKISPYIGNLLPSNHELGAHRNSWQTFTATSGFKRSLGLRLNKFLTSWLRIEGTESGRAGTSSSLLKIKYMLHIKKNLIYYNYYLELTNLTYDNSVCYKVLVSCW